MRLLFSIVLTIMGIYAQAQTISGIVRDSITKENIQYVSITLHTYPDSVLYKGVITDKEGNFAIKNIQKGKYFFTVTYWNYKTLHCIIDIDKDTDIGLINMTANLEQLAKVEVHGNREFLDKKVYYADSLLMSKAVTSIDILAKIPELQVKKSSYSVSVNGEASIIMINGIRTNTQLQSINPKEIERIEVISNPSSEYDTYNNIVNFILKKPDKSITISFNNDILLPLKRNETLPIFTLNHNKIRYQLMYIYLCSCYNRYKNKHFVYKKQINSHFV